MGKNYRSESWWIQKRGGAGIKYLWAVGDTDVSTWSDVQSTLMFSAVLTYLGWILISDILVWIDFWSLSAKTAIVNKKTNKQLVWTHPSPIQKSYVPASTEWHHCNSFTPLGSMELLVWVWSHFTAVNRGLQVEPMELNLAWIWHHWNETCSITIHIKSYSSETIYLMVWIQSHFTMSMEWHQSASDY